MGTSTSITLAQQIVSSFAVVAAVAWFLATMAVFSARSLFNPIQGTSEHELRIETARRWQDYRSQHWTAIFGLVASGSALYVAASAWRLPPPLAFLVAIAPIIGLSIIFSGHLTILNILWSKKDFEALLLLEKSRLTEGCSIKTAVVIATAKRRDLAKQIDNVANLYESNVARLIALGEELDS